MARRAGSTIEIAASPSGSFFNNLSMRPTLFLGAFFTDAPSSAGTAKLRRECLSGGEVFEAPPNVIVLIVATAGHVVICDAALAVKRMHVF
jgi:hypothetical protein